MVRILPLLRMVIVGLAFGGVTRANNKEVEHYVEFDLAQAEFQVQYSELDIQRANRRGELEISYTKSLNALKRQLVTESRLKDASLVDRALTAFAQDKTVEPPSVSVTFPELDALRESFIKQSDELIEAHGSAAVQVIGRYAEGLERLARQFRAAKDPRTAGAVDKERAMVLGSTEYADARRRGQGVVSDERSAIADGREAFVNSVGLEMVPVKGGAFTMGDDPQPGVRQDAARRRVRVTGPYWIGRTEVTQAAFERIMTFNPSRFPGPKRPVEQVTWAHANEFCSRLTELERKEGRMLKGYRYVLPTEAQWEFATRAGAPIPRFHTSPERAWMKEGSKGETHPVGQLKGNRIDLRDTLGNVKEWCADGYAVREASDEPGVVIDPVGPADAPTRVVKGGGYKNGPARCRPGSRSEWLPFQRADDIGFRLALVPEKSSATEKSE